MSDDGRLAGGSALRALRTAAGLTIDDLAARSGVSLRTIGGIERGRIRRPHEGTLTALAEALRLGPDDGDRLRAAVRIEPAVIGLPRLTPCFTGRDDDLDRLTGAVSRHRVIELAGLPGIGKSALAAQAATRLSGDFPDGVRFVALRGSSAPHPAALARDLARSLGADLPDDDAGAVVAWRRLLDERRVLLILDDATDAVRLAPLLPHRGESVAVVTTSGPLSLPPRRARRVLTPLPVPDAELALHRMIGPAVPDAGIAELARHCHGLPLALRIVANRVRTRHGWSIARLTAQLARPGRHLEALTAGDLSVGAALDRGYRQMPESLRAAVRALAAPTPPAAALADLAGCGWIAPHHEVNPILHAFAVARTRDVRPAVPSTAA
ncbi:helix-turn-helix domain-containing protein [Verrucosispora sp. NA02020]|uniref:helix-turn-helix domain-containing protein n=1 Tax=unclassified Micromonospora TaxID=2617518 RepID=UPI00159058C7|nr:helix-turn-helix domain-containing protein [Verrucosispora sp. NA02020]QKW13531.1 helix-turn-helix domain-containing protein [Verrucosispora sp. NA02020]